MIIQLPIENKRITDLLHGHGGSVSPWLRGISGEWHGIGRLSLDGDQIGRINQTLLAMEKAGVRKVRNRLKK